MFHKKYTENKCFKCEINFFLSMIDFILTHCTFVHSEYKYIVEMIIRPFNTIAEKKIYWNCIYFFRWLVIQMLHVVEWLLHFHTIMSIFIWMQWWILSNRSKPNGSIRSLCAVEVNNNIVVGHINSKVWMSFNYYYFLNRSNEDVEWISM